MNLTIERYHPWLVALAATSLWVYFKPAFPGDEKEFLGAAISLGAILTGFIATAKAILAALPNDSVMGRLRSSGYITDLISYLAGSLYGCLAFSVYGVFGFFLLKENQHALSSWYANGWIFLATFSLLSFIRVSRALLKIIEYTPKS